MQCRAKCAEKGCDNRCEGIDRAPMAPGERHACMEHEPNTYPERGA